MVTLKRLFSRIYICCICAVPLLISEAIAVSLRLQYLLNQCWKSYLFNLCKLSYNTWELTVTLFFNNKSIQKWRHCSVFLECLEFIFECFANCGKRFEFFILFKVSYNAWEGTVTLFFNKKSIQKWRYCSVFSRMFTISFRIFC